MNKKIVALLLCLGMAVTALYGCKKENTPAPSESETDAVETTEAESDTESSEESSAESSEEDIWLPTAADFSKGLADNGFIKDVKALDYVTLPDFEKIVYEAADLNPTEEVLEQEIQRVMSEFKPQVTDRAVENGDRVNIDYTGYMDDEPFDNGAAQGQDVTAGSEEFIDDFLTQIIGHKPGETMDVLVTFPDPYPNNPDFSGKDAKFVVTINYLYGDAPELTDEWMKDADNNQKLNDFFSTEGLENTEQVREFVTEAFYAYNLQNEINTYLSEKTEVSEIPEAVNDYAKNAMNIQMYTYYGMTVDQFIANNYTTEENIQQMTEQSAKSVLFCQALAEQEGWEITEADFKDITGAEDNTAYIEQFGKGYLANMVLNERTIKYFKEHVTINK